MNITINGQSHSISDYKCLSELINELDLANGALAVAINQQVIPRSQYETIILQAGDQVEFVRAVGGG
jgi:thiamine biosynthesis protein ThiS